MGEGVRRRPGMVMGCNGMWSRNSRKPLRPAACGGVLGKGGLWEGASPAGPPGRWIQPVL